MTIFMQNILAMSSSASAAQSYWISTLGGTGSDLSYYKGMAVDSSGNVFIAGYTNSQGAGGYDLALAKFNSSGELQWSKVIGSSIHEEGAGVGVDSSGNVYVSGTINGQSGSTSFGDVFVAKFDTSGAIQWQRSLTGAGNDLVRGFTVSPTGNCYLVGETNSQVNSGGGASDWFVAKYNSSGTLQWQKLIGGNSTETAFGVALDISENVYIAGRTFSTGVAGGADAMIVKCNSSGTVQWSRVLGGSGTDLNQSIAVDSSGNCFVSGSTTSQGAGGSDGLIAKYDTNGTIQWQRVLGGTGTESISGICVDGDGSVYVAGNTTSQGMGGEDVLIAKYDTNGTIQWQRTLGGNGLDRGYAIIADSSSIYVTGHTYSFGAGNGDLFVTKLPKDGSLTGTYGHFTYRVSTLTAATSTLTANSITLSSGNATLTDSAGGMTVSNGTLTSTNQNLVPAPSFWIGTLGGSGTDQGRSTVTDSAGNIYVCGSTNSQGAGGYDGLLIKYNSQGAIQWQKTIGNAGAGQYLLDVAIDASDNLYTTGYDSQNANDILIAKYNSAGEIQWQRSLGGAGSDACSGVAVDSSGNVHVVGNTASQGAGSIDALIVKYDSNGTIQWQRSLGGTGDENASAVATDSSGNVYFVGFTTSQGAGGYDLLLAKYNSSGTIQWQRSLGGASSESGNGIAVDSSGNVYVTSYTASQGAGGEDLLIAKYNSSGTIQWQRSLGGTGNERGSRVSVDSVGNVYVAGYTASQGAGGNDALIAKYDTNGTIQWQRSLGGSGADTGLGITVASDGSLIVVGDTASAGAGGTDIFVAKLPADGSLTGTYGSFTYAARTLTDAARTLTDSARTLTDSARTLTDAASTLTDQAATLTANKTTVQ